ncbi:hypothetical protein O3M35_001291 [Rhynocoris fuscipes]|uniref:N-terminal acetyltransferase B complex subunit MDM20 homolog n=1 Tax=Rhynocoris fuscipes TaxID=488301 RepID=A0AAW1DTK4_9HEMI
MTSRLSGYPVSERRLRPIYDWLDNGNNKKALQEADKVLKKQPNLQCAKVLRCLALLRLGKESDCIQQLEAIKEECPVEEASLQAMTVCYREIHKPHLICDLYEKANVKDPGNEEILTNLFLSYVRIGDYKKQQQTAMTLYKVKKKNQYYFWCVISILLQAVDKLSDLIHALLCSLAEKMLEKFINEDKIESEQEILIYLTSLELQGKTERGLEVLNGPLADKLEPYIVLNKRVNFLIKLGKWQEVNEIIRSTLETDLDSWNYYLFYLDSLFELAKDKVIDHENTDDCQFYRAKSFIQRLIEQNKALIPKKRGPYLAQLEYFSRLISNSMEAERLLGSIVDLLVEYYEEFGTKECCVHDLRPYLRLMSDKDYIEFLARGYKLVSLAENKLPKTKQQMNFLICNMECSRVIGLREMFDIKSKTEFTSNAVNYFIYSQQFNMDLQPTEVRSSDRFALLALHSFFDLWVDTQDSNYLFEAIVICQYALSLSPSNSQFKTLLLKFYHLLGGCKGAHNAYLMLDVKHMQLDTLGYIHVFPLLANADYATATDVISSTMKFFTNNFKESADHITFAYKYDALTKIPEFIWVREKLNNSTHYMKVRFERMLLDIFFASSHSNTLQLIKDFEISPLEKIQWSSLQDNRDFTVLWDMEPDGRMFERDAIKQTYNYEIIYLRLRCILVHVIAGCMYAGLGETNNTEGELDNFDIRESLYNYNVSKSILKKLLIDLEENLEALKTNPPSYATKKFIAAPPESRLLLTIQYNYFELILFELKFIIELIPGSDCDKDKCASLLNDIILFCEEYVKNLCNIAGSKNPSKRNCFIQMAALYAELIAFSTIIVGVCENITKKLKQNFAKKNKKKREPAAQRILNSDGFDWRMDIINRFIVFITENVKQVETLLKTEEKLYGDRTIFMGDINISKIDDKKEENTINILKSTVNDNLLSSYTSSLNQIISLMKVKLKYLSCHKI